MGNIVLSLFINGLMALLLLVTILYCWRLNTRIRILQDSKSDLARIIREFDESTQRATQSIAEIHEATSRLSDNIQHKIDKGNYLADDLQMLIERGGKLMGRSEPLPPRSASMASSPPAKSLEAPPARPARNPLTAMKEAVHSPAQPATAAPAVSDAEPSGSRRALRMRSKAEQELIKAVGTKNDSES
jgi:hypothetical protein